MNNVTRIIQVTTPQQARDFLRSLRGPNGEVVETVLTSEGKSVQIEGASDQDVLLFAKEMVRALGKANATVEAEQKSAQEKK